jgi:hypothetical protein
MNDSFAMPKNREFMNLISIFLDIGEEERKA